MPLFFIVSGLLFANSTHKEYSLVIKSKVKRLVLPYVSYHMLTLGMKVFMPNLVNRKIESLQDFSMEVMLRGGVVVSLCFVLAVHCMGCNFA